MSRGNQTFRQGDVTKALKGAQNAGIEVQRIEIETGGKIVVFAGKPDQRLEGRLANEWDDVR
jgi:hypothetical protein